MSMRKTRSCVTKQLNTGVSKCQIDFDKIKGALIVEKGVKLPADLTLTSLEEMCHADRPGRVYPVLTFVEYAKSGGEPQVGSTGYGPTGVTGVSARTDTFTMDKFYEALNSALLKAMNIEYDVYFWDAKNLLIGYNDGTTELAGIPMSTIYPVATPHPTSSANATMTVNFCHKDAQKSLENFDYIQLDFDPSLSVTGLVGVLFEKAEGENDYKIVEAIGGYDRTSEFGQLIADGATEVLNGVTSATYDADKDVITIVPGDGGTPSLKAPSVLFTNGIKGIEQV